jgi:hypothetical protein
LPEEATVAVPGVTVTLSGGITVTVAVADLVGSSTLAAVIRTVVVAVTLGEVNMPPPEIVPWVADHATRVCWVLLTVARNNCCFEAFIVAVVGLIETLTGGLTVTTAAADSAGSATLVAVTETVVSAFTVGAVNKPVLETDPSVADHVTARLSLPVTFAVNCWVSVEGTLAVVGVTYTWTGWLGVALAVFPAMPINTQNTGAKNLTMPIRRLNWSRL